MDDLEFEIQGGRNLCPLQNVRPALGSTLASYLIYTGDFYRPVREVDHSSSSNADVKNA